MTQVLTACCPNDDFQGAGETRYAPLSDSNFDTQNTSVEAYATVTARVAGTYSNLHYSCQTNTTTSSSTVNFRKNGAAGNQSVTVSSGTTGLFEDTGNTDTVSAGDTYSAQVINGGGGNLYGQVGALFEASSGVAKTLCASGVGSTSTASQTTYVPICGNIVLNSSEALSQARVLADGDLSNGQIYVLTNGRSTTTTLSSRVNSADGNISISVGAGVTGVIEDTSNTDAIAAGDNVNFKLVTGTGTGSFLFTLCGVHHLLDSTKFPIYAHGISSGSSAFQSSIVGEAGLGNPFSNYVVPTDLDTEDFTAYASANSSTSTTTVALQIDGVDGNQSVSFGSGITGLMQDLSNTDSITAGEYMRVSVTGMNASITFRQYALLAEIGGGAGGGGNPWYYYAQQ